MTNEQINIAIAEACGWKHYHEDLWVNPDFSGDPDGFSELQCGDLPDYINDLNAMHEAENHLKSDEKESYWNQLYEKCDRSVFSRVEDNYKMLRATASQRAEAFLKTIGRWEGDKP
jgi:hypothetical protein